MLRNPCFHILALLLFAVLPFADTAHAVCELEEGGAGRVVEVRDAETVRLEDGTDIRLINVVSPRTPLWLPEDEVWRAAETAWDVLERLTLDRQVRYAPGGGHEDRNGRTLAHVFVTSLGGGPEIWVQGAMVSEGHARAAPFEDTATCINDLLVLEEAARAQGLGLWADDHYRIRASDAVDDIAKLLNHFHLVEGTVHAVAELSSRTYLNFAEEWREDFTISIGARGRRLFEAAGIDLGALQGARIRVRGWIRNYNGPMIEVTEPEQIELLAE